MDITIFDNYRDYEYLCRIIKDFRISSKHEQLYMAKLLGITQSDYSRRENGTVVFSADDIKILYANGFNLDTFCGAERYDNLSSETILNHFSNNISEVNRDFFLKILSNLIVFYKQKNNLTTGSDYELINGILDDWDNFSMIKFVRNSKGKTQEQMSDILQLTRKRYRLYERENIYPDAELLVRLCKYSEYVPSLFLNVYNRKYYAIQSNLNNLPHSIQEEIWSIIDFMVDKL